MKVTLDPAITPPEDWAKRATDAWYMSYDEGIGALLVALMSAGYEPERFELRCGRQMLCWYAKASGNPVILDGVPRVSFYTIGGAVTAMEDRTLEQEEIAFRLRPASAAATCPTCGRLPPRNETAAMERAP